MDLSSSIPDRTRLSSGFQVYPNHPNPFSSGTHIDYAIPEAGIVSIRIYDALGRKLGEFIPGKQPAGRYSREIRLGNYGSGIYYYTVDVQSVHTGNHYQKTNRMILLK